MVHKILNALGSTLTGISVFIALIFAEDTIVYWLAPCLFKISIPTDVSLRIGGVFILLSIPLSIYLVRTFKNVALIVSSLLLIGIMYCSIYFCVQNQSSDIPLASEFKESGEYKTLSTLSPVEREKQMRSGAQVMSTGEWFELMESLSASEQNEWLNMMLDQAIGTEEFEANTGFSKLSIEEQQGARVVLLEQYKQLFNQQADRQIFKD